MSKSGIKKKSFEIRLSSNLALISLLLKTILVVCISNKRHVQKYLKASLAFKRTCMSQTSETHAYAIRSPNKVLREIFPLLHRSNCQDISIKFDRRSTCTLLRRGWSYICLWGIPFKETSEKRWLMSFCNNKDRSLQR